MFSSQFEVMLLVGLLVFFSHVLLASLMFIVVGTAAADGLLLPGSAHLAYRIL